MRTRRFYLTIGLSLQILIGPRLCQGQQVIVLDWSKRPTTQGAAVDLDVSGSTNGQQSVNFQITDVNNILYQYTMSCQLRADSSPSTDFSQLIGVLLSGKVEGSDNDANAQKVLDSLADYLSQSSCAKTNNCSSIKLQDTLDNLNSVLGPVGKASDTTLNGLIAKDKQTAGGDLSDDARAKVLAAAAHLQSLMSATHSVSFTESIDSAKSYACTVAEYLTQPQNGELLSTKDGTMAISVGKPANVVTLSIGPLFSAIENRTYSAATVPNGSSGTSTVLEVQGKSPSTSIVALANFALPLPSSWKLESDKFGLAVAAGPAVRLNSSSGTSAAGFFAGLSVHLWRQLFITPGVHVGQFADYPPGFSAPGQKIPANFPTPQPVARTTVRFGVSLSYLTKDFGVLKQNGTATTTSPSGSKPAPPKAATAAPPATPVKDAGATSPGITVVPNPVDFSSANTSVAVTISNVSGKAAPITWKVPEGRTPIDYSDGVNKCQNLAAGTACVFQLKLARGTAYTPTTLQIGIVGTKPVDVDVKWQ